MEDSLRNFTSSMPNMKMIVVGSGPAAVSAAAALVGRGYYVEMIDFGNEMEDSARRLSARFKNGEITTANMMAVNDKFQNINHCKLKRLNGLTTALRWALLSRVSSEQNKKKLWGSLFTYRDVDDYIKLTENSPQCHRSLAMGGLSNVWGAACFPFTEEDFKEWPITKEDVTPHYRIVNDILQLNETNDVLSEVYSVYLPKNITIPLNPQSTDLLNKWNMTRQKLRNSGFLFGRSRLAVLTKDQGERLACQLCGLCLHGCPYDSVYNSAFTVAELCKNNRFHYRSSLFLRKFRESDDGKIFLEVEDRKNQQITQLECDKLFLGAGTLSTLRIVADSLGIYQKSVSVLDNGYFLLPLIRRSNWFDYEANVKFTLSQLVLLINNKSICDENVHTQIYSYNDYVFGRFSPVLNIFPNIIRQRLRKLMYNTFIMFGYLHSKHSVKMCARVINEGNGTIGRIRVDCEKNYSSKIIIDRIANFLKANGKDLGLYPLKIGMKITEPGVSGHIAGTLPMRAKPGLFETYGNGLLFGTKSVYIVDQSTFPSLPSQNITYTAMANAHRIATNFDKKDTLCAL